MATKRLQLSKTILLTKEQGGASLGAGAEDVLAAGMLHGTHRARRFVMWVPGGIPADWWDDVGGVSDGRIWLRGTNEGKERVDLSTSTRHRVRRLLAVPSGGEGSNTSVTTAAPATWDDVSHTAADNGELTTPNLGDVRNKLISFSVLGIAIWHAPTSISGKASQKAQATFGFVVARYDDTFSANPWTSDWPEPHGNIQFDHNGEYWGEDKSASYEPYFELTYDSNRAPDAPTVTSPVTQDGSTPQIVASADGKTVPVTWVFNDPDTGDRATRVQHNIHDVLGNYLRQIGIDVDVARGASRTDTLTGFAARTEYQIAPKTRDSALAWSPFTLPLTDHKVKTAYLPGVPLNPSPGATVTDGAGFHILGSINSQDSGDFVTGWEGEFYKDTSSGSIAMWTPGMQSIGGTSTRSDVTYGGTPYLAGETARWRHRHRNRDGVVSPSWSPWSYTKVGVASGPTAMSPTSRETKINSLTGPLTIGDAVAFTTSHWRLYRGDQVIHDSTLQAHASTTSRQVTILAGLVQPGELLAWEAVTSGAWSPRYPIRFNADPYAPEVSFPGGILRADGSWVIPTASTSMVIRAPFDDPDQVTDADVATERRTEVRLANAVPGAGAHVTGSPQTLTTGIDDEETWSTGLTLESSYDVQVRHKDNAARQGPVSAWERVKLSQPPTAAITSPEAGAHDTFTRTVASGGWGTPDVGPAWVHAGTAADASVNGSYAQHFRAAGNGASIDETLPVSVRDVDMSGRIRLDALPVGASVRHIVLLRLGGGLTDTYRFYIFTTVTGAINIQFLANATTINTQNGVMTITAGQWLRFRVQGIGADPTTLRARVWLDGTAEPETWQLEITDSTAGLQDAGSARCWSVGSSLVTNALTFGWDDIVVANIVFDPTVTAISTYSSPGAKAKLRSVWKWFRRIAGVDEEIKSSVVEGTGLSDTLPPGVLTASGQTIALDVEHTDSDGLRTVSARRTFTTSFSPPAAPTGLTAIPETESGSVALAWTASAGPYVYEHRVYWRDGRGEYVLIATLAADATGYVHHGGRHGSNDYQVTAHTGAMESEPASAEATLDALGTTGPGGTGAFVRVGDARHTVSFRVGGAPRVRGSGVESHEPPGRGTPVHYKWGISSRSVTVPIQYLPSEDGDLATLFDDLLNEIAPGWLKIAPGYLRDPMWCEVVDVSDAIERAGWMSMSVTFEETGA